MSHHRTRAMSLRQGVRRGFRESGRRLSTVKNMLEGVHTVSNRRAAQSVHPPLEKRTAEPRRRRTYRRVAPSRPRVALCRVENERRQAAHQLSLRLREPHLQRIQRR